MNDTNISALFALIGVLAGWGISVITNWNNNRNENNRLKDTLEVSKYNNQKNIAVQYITSKRVDWIYEVRGRLSEFISLTQVCANLIVEDNIIKIPEETSRELNMYFAMLRLLFNFDGDDDLKILYFLNKIKDNISETKNFNPLDFEKDIISLTRYSQVYLKLEWERVKLEIKGKTDLENAENIENELSDLRAKYDKEYLMNESDSQNGR